MARGPNRGEHKVRVAIGVLGLGLAAGGFALTGINSLAAFEIILISTAFFGGTALWSAWKLYKGP